jgi:hypothetical protein
MNINLIIISRYGNQTFIDKVKSLNLTAPENTSVIYPTSEQYETTLIIPYFKLPSDGSWYNLVIYDWSTTMSSNINSDIQDIYNSLSENFDVMYLGKYLDTCNNYSVKENINSFSLVSGTDPVGFNAAILTTSFSEKIIPYLQNNKFYTLTYAINEYKIQNTIIEYSTAPNLFVFDPLYTSIDVSNSYSVKSQECQGITSQIIPPSDNNLTIFWILIIVCIIALLIWLFINFTSYGQSIEAKRSNVQYSR